MDMSALMVRVERMLYLSGPAPGMKPLNMPTAQVGHRRSLWQVDIPVGLQVYAYLTEVQPGLLALSYLSGCFDKGDLIRIEVQLESVRLSSGVRPAENGMALLVALQQLARQSVSQGKAPEMGMEQVAVE
jgi:hypothetical protein